MQLVLDTNVALDWLVFGNAYMNPLMERVADGRVIVLTHSPAIDELRRVLSYRTLKLAADRQAAILERYCSQTQTATLPDNFSLTDLRLPHGFPRCRDPDDQHFLALAYHVAADALVSRDKAVLKLAKRARRFGVRVLDVPQLMANLGCLR